MDVEQPVGAALSRVLAPGEAAERSIDEFIEKRHRQRVKEEGERQEREAWKESSRKHEERRRQQARLEWHHFHAQQAGRHRRMLEALIEHHEAEASRLGGDAA